MKKNILLKSVSGFTLVEMLVAMSIFTIATVYSVSIFSQSNQVQKRTANIQRVISDARYTMEVIAREVRMGTVDYEYESYELPLDSLQTELALINENDQPIRFKRFERAGERFVVQVCKGVAECAAETYLDITPEDLSVEALSFYISPSRDPFTIDYTLERPSYYNDIQPLVTIIMKTKSTHTDLKDLGESYFQTTMVPRKYVR